MRVVYGVGFGGPAVAVVLLVFNWVCARRRLVAVVSFGFVLRLVFVLVFFRGGKARGREALGGEKRGGAYNISCCYRYKRNAIPIPLPT